MCPIATTHPGCHNRNPLASQPSGACGTALPLVDGVSAHRRPELVAVGVCGEPVEVQCGEQQPAAMSAAARAAHAQTPRPECLSALGASASRLYSRSSNEAVRHVAAAWLTRYRCNENNSQTRTPEAAPFAQLMGRTSVSKGGPVAAHTQKRTIFEALHRRRGSTPRNISWPAELRAAWTGVG